MKKDSKTALKKKSGTTVKVQENKFNKEQILQLALNQVKYEKKKNRRKGIKKKDACRSEFVNMIASGRMRAVV